MADDTNRPAAGAGDHERLMADYTALWNGDLSKLDVVAADVTVSHPSAPDGEVHGRDGLKEFIEAYHRAFPDFHVTAHEYAASGDLVMKTWTMRGTHEGTFDGVPPTGREVESRGMAAIRVADGVVQADRLYFDRLATLDQLGLLGPELVGQLPRLAAGAVRERL